MTGSDALADRSERETGVVMSSGSSSVFAGFRFPPEFIEAGVLPACSRRPVVCRRDLYQDRWPVDLSVLGDRPVRPGHRRHAVGPAGPGRGPAVLHPGAARRVGPRPCLSAVLDELVPSALHTVERYANNPVEADHGRLKARLRPMRGLRRHRSARILAAGHAFVQNLRRGHYELATDIPARHRIPAAFDQLAMTI